jgi:hypothetical protein
MKKTLLVLSAALSILPQASFAKTSFPLVCALGKAQDLSKLDGYVVTEGTRKKSGGGLEGVLTLKTYENGEVVESSILSDEIREYTERQMEKDDVTYTILKSAKVDPGRVKSGKSVKITDGDPAVVLVNYFDADGEMLTGGILVPVGGIQLCHPVTE